MELTSSVVVLRIRLDVSLVKSVMGRIWFVMPYLAACAVSLCVVTLENSFTMISQIDPSVSNETDCNVCSYYLLIM